jgi:hypothetical protein
MAKPPEGATASRARREIRLNLPRPAPSRALSFPVMAPVFSALIFIFLHFGAARR